MLNVENIERTESTYRELASRIAHMANDPKLRMAIIFSHAHSAVQFGSLPDALTEEFASRGSVLRWGSSGDLRFKNGAIVSLFDSVHRNDEFNRRTLNPRTVQAMSSCTFNTIVFPDADAVDEDDVSMALSRLRHGSGEFTVINVREPKPQPASDHRGEVVFFEVDVPPGGFPNCGQHRDDVEKLVKRELAGTGIHAVVLPCGVRAVKTGIPSTNGAGNSHPAGMRFESNKE